MLRSVGQEVLMGNVQVLSDQWGVENLAIAIPKGRDLAAPFLAEFAKQQQDSGAIEAIAKRAGLRGTAKD